MTPAALSRKEAAEYVGVSPVTFDKLVRMGEMPKGRRYKHADRIVWRTVDLDDALAALPVDGETASSPYADVEL